MMPSVRSGDARRKEDAVITEFFACGMATVRQWRGGDGRYPEVRDIVAVATLHGPAHLAATHPTVQRGIGSGGARRSEQESPSRTNNGWRSGLRVRVAQTRFPSPADQRKKLRIDRPKTKEEQDDPTRIESARKPKSRRRNRKDMCLTLISPKQPMALFGLGKPAPQVSIDGG
jgi:hypothetical protein